MAPSTSAEYVCLYDRCSDDDGKTYIAKFVGGKMAWVLETSDQQCPLVPADLMNEGDVLIGEDKREYTVMVSKKGIKSWALKQSKMKKAKKNNSDIPIVPCIPDMPVDVLDVGDIQTGCDGTEYIVKMIGGVKQYVVYQKSYKWSKTGVMYTTLENDCGYSPAPLSKTKSAYKKKALVKA